MAVACVLSACGSWRKAHLSIFSVSILVSAQRKNYKLLEANSAKSTPLSMERAQRLLDVGFEWTAKNPRHLMWEVRFAELKDFKVGFG